MKTNEAGRTLIKRWEGYRSKAYLCPAGVWTIGWGHTTGVKEGQTCTAEEAERMLNADLAVAENALRAVLGPDLVARLNENQFSALVSLVFNVGAQKLARSTLVRRLREGRFEGAALQFGRWVYAGGVQLPGLVARRRAEALLFMAPLTGEAG